MEYGQSIDYICGVKRIDSYPDVMIHETIHAHFGSSGGFFICDTIKVYCHTRYFISESYAYFCNSDISCYQKSLSEMRFYRVSVNFDVQIKDAGITSELKFESY